MVPREPALLGASFRIRLALPGRLQLREARVGENEKLSPVAKWGV